MKKELLNFLQNSTHSYKFEDFWNAILIKDLKNIHTTNNLIEEFNINNYYYWLMSIENHKERHFLPTMGNKDNNWKDLKNYIVKEVKQRWYTYKDEFFFYEKDYNLKINQEIWINPIPKYLKDAMKKEILNRINIQTDRIILEVSDKNTFEKIKEKYPFLIKTEWRDYTKNINN